MGFLKFLHKEKRKEGIDDLDLPPPPPPLEGFEETLPGFQEFDNNMHSKDELPSFDFPEMEETEKYAPPVSAPIPPIRTPSNQPAPSIPRMQEPEQVSEDETGQSSYYPKMSGRLFAHERISLRQRPNVKTIYVRIDNFKATLGSINIVRSDLRKSEEALNKLETLKSSKDRSFDKVKVSIDDLQKKLIFIDKTLFKGE